MLTKTLAQPVNLSKFETNLFSRIEVTGLQVITADNPSSTVIEIPTLRIRYDLLNFLRSDFKLDSVLISSLIVNLGRDSLGRFNLELLNPIENKTESPKSSNNPLQFSINYIDLKSGFGSFNDQEFRVGGALRGLSSLIRVQGLSKIDFQAKAEAIDVSKNGKSFSVGELFVSGDWTSPDLTIDSLTLASSDLTLASHGKMSFEPPIPIITAECQLEVFPLNIIDSLTSIGIPSLPRIDGMIAANLTISGTLDEPIVGLNAESDLLQWDSVVTGELLITSTAQKSSGVWAWETTADCKRFSIPDNEIDSVYFFSSISLSDSTVSIKNFSFSIPDLTVQGDGEIHMFDNDTTINGIVKVAGSATETADIIAFFISPIVGDFAGDIDLVGEINGSIDNLEYRLSGSIPALQYQNLSVTNLLLRTQYGQGRLALNDFDGNLAKGRF